MKRGRLSKKQLKLCEESKDDFSDLKALFINCTLKKSPKKSNTDGLIKISKTIMEKNGVKVEEIRAVDHEIPPGVWPNMKKKGWKKDVWPKIFKKVMEADILILGTPIWLGATSSVCKKVIERLYGQSGELNKKGQFVYYGKVGGCIITGNEDGMKHCARDILYSLQHIGYTIPPQADSGWVGEAGPGPSYSDRGSGGPENDFTQRNTAFMTWNLMHMARMLKDSGGIPAHGNQKDKWEAGCKSDHPNPEFR